MRFRADSGLALNLRDQPHGPYSELPGEDLEHLANLASTHRLLECLYRGPHHNVTVELCGDVELLLSYSLEPILLVERYRLRIALPDGQPDAAGRERASHFSDLSEQLLCHTHAVPFPIEVNAP